VSLDNRILAALVRWSDAREHNESLSVEELCRECPELANELRGRIKMLEAMQWLETLDEPSPPPQRPLRSRRVTQSQGNDPTK
jgi:hypothetical protein